MTARIETTGTRRLPHNILKLRQSPPPPAAEGVSERQEGARRSLSPTPGSNRDPNPSGDSFPMHPVSDWIRFRDFTLWYSGEESVTGFEAGRSLVSILGTVLTCRREVSLPTACEYLPAAARTLVLKTSPFPRGHTWIS